jgi:hypothetical protein
MNSLRCLYRSVKTERIERLCESKIQHLDGAVIAKLDVRGLEVAMDDALLVCRFECRTASASSLRSF